MKGKQNPSLRFIKHYYLCIEFCQNFEVSLEVCGQNVLYNQEAEPLEFSFVQARQEVMFGVGQEEVPGGSCVVVF